MNLRLRLILITLIPAGAFLADRATKAAARSLYVTSGTPLQTGIIDTVVHENRGIVANLPVPLPLIIALTAAVILVIAFAWRRSLIKLRVAGGARPERSLGEFRAPHPQQSNNQTIKQSGASSVVRAVALGLILGGALSNLYDRATAGFVYDWILLFGRSAVNVADGCIVAGAILFAIGSGRKRGIDG